MTRFDFTKEEYEILKDKMMLGEELEKIFKMKIEGCSVVEIGMKLGMSDATVKRKVKKIKKRLEKVIMKEGEGDV